MRIPAAYQIGPQINGPTDALIDTINNSELPQRLAQTKTKKRVRKNAKNHPKETP